MEHKNDKNKNNIDNKREKEKEIDRTRNEPNASPTAGRAADADG